MTQYEHEEMQDMSWMYETSDDVLFDCFNGDIDLDPTDGDIELEKILEGEYSLIP